MKFLSVWLLVVVSVCAQSDEEWWRSGVVCGLKNLENIKKSRGAFSSSIKFIQEVLWTVITVAKEMCRELSVDYNI
jgi:hypothetical protein